jgi:GNAT superfamily N-acetyltransferase
MTNNLGGYTMNKKIEIKPYEKSDRSFVRDICWMTALMGDSGNLFLDKNAKEMFVDYWTKYYTDFEPESLFVAKYNEKVVGYIMGCLDETKYNQIFFGQNLISIIKRCLQPKIIFNIKNISFLYHSLVSLARGEYNLSLPSCSAHLHINILKGWRKQGIGTMLINRLFDHMRRTKINCIKAVTSSEQGANFFEKNGFVKFFSRPTYAWFFVLKRTVNLTVYILDLQRIEKRK